MDNIKPGNKNANLQIISINMINDCKRLMKTLKTLMITLSGVIALLKFQEICSKMVDRKANSGSRIFKQSGSTAIKKRIHF